MAGPFKSVREIDEGRSAEFDDSGNRKYTRTFRVATNDPALAGLAVMFAPGVPKLLDYYQSFRNGEFDYYALCRRVAPDQDSVYPTVWKVRCERRR